mmetsp:Transcript_25966/g.60040  ORF Transcript_25966/g.60040 Transcript_25966/m.60040 type:complete len:386 (+) Transcript_25966:231-1388(+)
MQEPCLAVDKLVAVVPGCVVVHDLGVGSLDKLSVVEDTEGVGDKLVSGLEDAKARRKDEGALAEHEVVGVWEADRRDHVAAAGTQVLDGGAGDMDLGGQQDQVAELEQVGNLEGDMQQHVAADRLLQELDVKDRQMLMVDVDMPVVRPQLGLTVEVVLVVGWGRSQVFCWGHDSTLVLAAGRLLVEVGCSETHAEVRLLRVERSLQFLQGAEAQRICQPSLHSLRLWDSPGSYHSGVAEKMKATKAAPPDENWKRSGRRLLVYCHCVAQHGHLQAGLSSYLMLNARLSLEICFAHDRARRGSPPHRLSADSPAGPLRGLYFGYALCAWLLQERWDAHEQHGNGSAHRPWCHTGPNSYCNTNVCLFCLRNLCWQIVGIGNMFDSRR